MTAALDFEHCYRAIESRDARFDGWFVVGVRTTGVYCRPSCPSPVCPKRKNVAFYRTAAAAQTAGFRACKRCRPDAVPSSPEWNVRGDLVGRAMRLIADGVVDRAGVPGLASALAVSERQLHRLLVEGVGASPLALARAQRAQTARTLIERTSLTFAEIAFASGFSSVRQFNDTIRQCFGSSPSQLRRAPRRMGNEPREALTLRLPVRTPFAATAALQWLIERALPGVEAADASSYERTLRLPHGLGIASFELHDDHVSARFRLDTVADLAAAVARARRLFDLDADPATYSTVLAADPVLAPLLSASPGLRAIGACDPAESALRTVLGQQISLSAARTIAGRLVSALGTPLREPAATLTHAFPDPDAIAAHDLDGLGLPRARRATIRELARQLASGELVLGPGADRADVRKRLLAIPGVGAWTADYISLRALGDPDAFPVGDLGLRRAAAALGLPATRAALEAHAERWRPWRAYAAHYLWAA